MQKIVPNLWFDGNAREAAEFYVSVFPNSKITGGSKYPESPEEGLADFQLNLAGKDLTIEFELNGQPYTAINAGPEFKFSEAISFAVFCKDQAEIDYFWENAKQVETRKRRVKRTCEELLEGKRRPCCWMGCIHRTDKEPGAWAKAVLLKR